ncbi:helix-turn-helix domain-containing protein [Mycolicibacterium hodleri]|nr:helix-turn-helix domain-containing protein [Mycolicibacterium hodleri]
MTTTAAWDEFDDGRDPRGIRPDIVRSWHRSQRAAVLPEGLDLGGTGETQASKFVDVAAPVLLQMADLLRGDSVTLALADADGRILWRWACERDLYPQLDQSEMIAGARFAERYAGTNGIGTALENGQTTLVVGQEHYKRNWQDWACIATPVVHPVTRRTAGAINIACEARHANQFLRVAIRSLGSEVSSALRASVGARQRRLLDALVAYRGKITDVPLIALDAQTMIIDGDANGLKADRAEFWELCRGRAGRTIALPGGRCARVLPVTQERESDGVVLVIDSGHSLTTSGPALSRTLGPLERSEVRVLRETLADCGGNKSAAADRLGISRGTLYRKVRAYRLDTGFSRDPGVPAD